MIVAGKVKMEDCGLPNEDAAAKGLFGCDFSAIHGCEYHNRWAHISSKKHRTIGPFRSAIAPLLTTQPQA